MRVGVLLLPTDPWDVTVRRARHLERLGYAHLWVYDHLSWRRYQDRPWHATYPWLAGMAGVTDTIRLGTMVANPNIRHPLLLAKDAMTIDHISAGRLMLGIGAGGSGFDARVLGQPEMSSAERASRLREFVTVLDRLLANELTDYHSGRYDINEARLLPGCVQQPRVPLAIAAGGATTLTVAADFADAWITYGDPAREPSASGTERVVQQQWESICRRCEERGRDPSSIDRIYLIGNTQARPLSSVQAFVDFAGRYQELGFTDLVFHDPRQDDPIWNEPAEIVDAVATELGLRMQG